MSGIGFAHWLSFAGLVLLWWLGLFLSISGWGLLVRRAYKLPLAAEFTWLSCFWLGWGFLLVGLQLVHWFYRIDGWVLFATGIVGLLGFACSAKQLLGFLRASRPKDYVQVLLCLLVALWLVNRINAPIGRSDTGLYHLAAVQWNERYPLVKGLGNLHGRLAFNNSSFLFAALVDNGPWPHQSAYLSNSFLLLMLLLQVIGDGIRLWKNPSERSSTPFFSALLVAPVVAEIFAGDLNSLSPDLPSFILSLILARALLDYLTTPFTTRREREFQFFALMVLASVGVTIKLSFLGFGVMSCLLAVWITSAKTPALSWLDFFQGVLPAMLFAVVAIGSWMMRGVWLSGYPAYPLTLGAFPVPWRVPQALALSDAYWIRSWARQPGVPWTDVIGNWRWLRPWLATIPAVWLKGFALIGLAWLALSGAKLFALKPPDRSQTPWQFLLLPVISLLYWFITAPSFRFANAALWIVTMGSLLLALDRFQILQANRRANYWLVWGAVLLFLWPFSSPLFLPISSPALPPLPEPNVALLQTQSGVQVAVPTGGNKCWNYPQPCTPYFRPNLHLFADHDLAQGFYLDDQFTYADIQQSALPRGITAPPDIGVQLVANLIQKPSGAYGNEPQATLRLLVYARQAGDFVLTASIAPTRSTPYDQWRAAMRLVTNGTESKALSSQMDRVVWLLPLQPNFNLIEIKVADHLLGFQPDPANLGKSAFAGVLFTALDVRRAPG